MSEDIRADTETPRTAAELAAALAACTRPCEPEVLLPGFDPDDYE
jgi:hypothetical protein